MSRLLEVQSLYLPKTICGLSLDTYFKFMHLQSLESWVFQSRLVKPELA